MEILRTPPQSPVRAMVFDFDGTISTLRCGWEEVMQPMLEETLRACGGAESDAEIAALAARYIDESTGIQTIFQMKWLAQQVAQPVACQINEAYREEVRAMCARWKQEEDPWGQLFGR